MTYRHSPLPEDNSAHGPGLRFTTGVVQLVDRLLPKQVNGEGHENILYLLASEEGDQDLAIDVYAPVATTTWGSYETSRDSHAEVLRYLAQHDLIVVAQVHSHPGSLVIHSDTDDNHSFIRGEGFWSIVVPHYGVHGFMPFSQCGFHLYRNGRFHLLTQKAVNSRIHLQPRENDAF